MGHSNKNFIALFFFLPTVIMSRHFFKVGLTTKARAKSISITSAMPEAVKPRCKWNKLGGAAAKFKIIP